MTNRPTRKPTGPTADELSDELCELYDCMCAVAATMRNYKGDVFGSLTHANELSAAASIVKAWSLQVKKEGKK